MIDDKTNTFRPSNYRFLTNLLVDSRKSYFDNNEIDFKYSDQDN